MFKTQHFGHYDRDCHFPIVDILLATTAAPTYFPWASIGSGGKYIYGGVWANNPIVVAVAESMAILRNGRGDDESNRHRFELDSIRALSVGTGKLATYLNPPCGEDGVFWWMNGGRLLETMFMAQSQGVGFQAEYLLADRYSRIDFDMPNSNWKLDSTEYIEQLIHIGREKGKANLLLFDKFQKSPTASVN